MRTAVIVITILIITISPGKAQGTAFAKEALEECVAKTRATLAHLKSKQDFDYGMMPRNIEHDGKNWNLKKATKEEWTAGFWPGVLWYMYEFSGDEKIRYEAERFTEQLAFLSRTPAYDHDIGFQVFCSYGNALRLTGNQDYKQIILNAADSLATLFNPHVGTILSWPREVKPRNWPHNTIIDNMMNLEMLFWAAGNGNNKNLKNIAVSHANSTMLHHFKPDLSCYHVAVYDTITGKFIKGVTHQGYSDASMWARGQSWAIYGYTLCYRETMDTLYLEFAQKIADAYLTRLPEDKIPYWDFDDPVIPNAPKDASAAAITASALLDLSGFVNGKKSRSYRDAALTMLRNLHKYYSSEGQQSFLIHSTGNKPAGYEINASIIYADYYYSEALLKALKIKE